ncbi:MAG: hypothetical protein MUE50_06615 [Pirellulaceae bacterium]|nr:hypothetical protein [Pirellulaceae bacterium]
MKHSTNRHFAILVVSVCLAGCGRAAPVAESPPTAKIDAAAYVLAAEPAGAQTVIPVRESAQDQDEVAVVGRIGGSANPWVDGRASFSIVDPALEACSDRPDDHCPQPWDYCCETDRLAKAKALVKVVDGQGRLLAADARELFALKELQTVVVQGKAQRDDAGNLTVLASGIYVRP